MSESTACLRCGKTGSLEYILAGCKKMLHQYIRRRNQVLEVLASAVKHQCQSKVPEPLRQGILFVRKSERAMQKYAWKVMPMVSSHDNWKMLADLHSPLVFPPQITVTSLDPDLVLWTVSLNTVLLAELTVPSESNMKWAYER